MKKQCRRKLASTRFTNPPQFISAKSNPLTMEKLEHRMMLNGDWTLLSAESTYDDLGQVVSSVEDYDYTGDDSADVRIHRRFTYEAGTLFHNQEDTVDHGIDGIFEQHYAHWASSADNVPWISHSLEAFDSDGDGAFDRFKYTGFNPHFDDFVMFFHEVWDYFDRSIVYSRSTERRSGVPISNGVVWHSVVDVDENADGVLESRVSTSTTYLELRPNFYWVIGTVVTETDEGADGSIDRITNATYEYTADYFFQLASITTQIDENGDGIFDYTTIESLMPDGSPGGGEVDTGEVVDEEAGGDEVDDGEVVDDGGGGGEVGDGEVVDEGVGEGGTIYREEFREGEIFTNVCGEFGKVGEGSIGNSESEPECTGFRNIEVDGESDVDAESPTGGTELSQAEDSLEFLAPSIDFSAYQVNAAIAMDDQVTAPNRNLAASLPITTTARTTDEFETTAIVVQTDERPIATSSALARVAENTGELSPSVSRSVTTDAKLSLKTLNRT